MAIPEALDSVDSVIDALGGTAAVARMTGRQAQAVSNWRARGVMPADMYFVMSEALRDLGFRALPTLWGMASASEPAEARP